VCAGAIIQAAHAPEQMRHVAHPAPCSGYPGTMNPAPDTPLRPWDRQPDESPESYRRFLVYRNLGPARTLTRACNQFNAPPDATESRGQHKKQPDGSWTADSANHNWVERACEWDIDNLVRAGDQTVVHFVELVRVFAEKVLQTAAEDDCKPGSGNWSQVESGLKTLSNFVPHEAVEKVRRRRAGRTADGRPIQPTVVGSGSGCVPGR
jgi:hypothetical protein